MKSIDELFERLQRNDNIDDVRTDIANLIAKYLSDSKESIGYWEKYHFLEAIDFLARNVQTEKRDSALWLKACLTSILTACTPKGERNENHVPKDHRLESLQYEWLEQEIRKLGSRYQKYRLRYIED